MVMGLAFENLVLRNYGELLKPLHLDRAIVKSAAPYRKNGTKRLGCEGFQIDLLLQTERSMCLVEIKRMEKVPNRVMDEVREKVRKFKRPKETSLRLALVYEGVLDPAIESEGFFDTIVDARSLLGLPTVE